MGTDDRLWRFVASYDVDSYACGLRASDRVALRKTLVILDANGLPTDSIHSAGEIWTVLRGSKEDSGVVWFRQADGKPHTWTDDRAEIDEWFQRVQESE